MKLKHTSLAALTCASLLGSAALSQAALLVSEEFTYADGPLNGQNGGTGFSDAWNSSVNIGGGVVGGNSSSFRNFTGAAFGNSGTLWVSFDWGYNSKPTEGGSYGGLTFYAGGGERFLIGNTWPGTGHDLWRMSGSSATSILNYGVKTGVAKITLGVGATSTVELWVGATGSPVYVGDAPLATVTDANLEGVNGIRIMGDDFGGVNSAFDNLLIGTTMADVDATDTPPVTPTYSWTGAVGTNFTEPANWAENVWEQWKDYAFGGNPTNASITIDGYFGINSLLLQNGLEKDIVINSTTAQPVIMGVGVAGNPLALITIAADSKNLTINGDYIASTPVTWDVGAGRTLTLNGPLNTWFNTASLVKKGGGTAVLTGANGYNGATTINGGTLKLQGGAFSTTARAYSIASDAVLQLDGNTSFAGGTTTISGGGTLRISGGELSAGDGGRVLALALGSGALIEIQSAGFLPNGGWQGITWTGNQAGLQVDGTFDVWDGNDVLVDALTGSGSVMLGNLHWAIYNKTITVGVAGGSGTFGGVISGTGSGDDTLNLVKEGSGTQRLTGTNTYNGTTTVSGGTLRIDGDSSGATGALTVESGALLGGSGSYGGSITFNDGAALNCELNLSGSTLTCGGQLSFTDLDFADCTFTVAPGAGYPPYRSFTLIEAASLGTATFANAKGEIDGVPAKLSLSGNKLMLSVGYAGTVITIR